MNLSLLLQVTTYTYIRRVYRAVSDVFQNSDPPTPLSTRRVCPPPATKTGGTHSLGGEWGGGSIFWKMQDIGLAFFSNNLSTPQPHPLHLDSYTIRGRYWSAKMDASPCNTPPLYPDTTHQLSQAVFRIHDILVWIRIRIRGSMPLTNGSGSKSCYFRH